MPVGPWENAKSVSGSSEAVKRAFNAAGGNGYKGSSTLPTSPNYKLRQDGREPRNTDQRLVGAFLKELRMRIRTKTRAWNYAKMVIAFAICLFLSWALMGAIALLIIILRLIF